MCELLSRSCIMAKAHTDVTGRSVVHQALSSLNNVNLVSCSI